MHVSESRFVHTDRRSHKRASDLLKLELQRWSHLTRALTNSGPLVNSAHLAAEPSLQTVVSIWDRVSLDSSGHLWTHVLSVSVSHELGLQVGDITSG